MALTQTNRSNTDEILLIATHLTIMSSSLYCKLHNQIRAVSFCLILVAQHCNPCQQMSCSKYFVCLSVAVTKEFFHFRSDRACELPMKLCSKVSSKKHNHAAAIVDGFLLQFNDKAASDYPFDFGNHRGALLLSMFCHGNAMGTTCYVENDIFFCIALMCSCPTNIWNKS